MAIKSKKPVGKVRKSALRPNKSVKKMVKRAMPNKKNSITWQGTRRATHNGAITWPNGMPSTPAPKQKRYKKPGNYSTGIGVGY